MQESLEKAEKLLKEEKYSEVLTLLTSIADYENDPILCAKIGHCYFKQKRFMKARKILKKIPKELLETEPYQEAKKELRKVTGFSIAVLMGL